MKYLENRGRFVKIKNYKNTIIESAVMALSDLYKDINKDNILTSYSNHLKHLLTSIKVEGYKMEAINSILEDIDWSNGNINKRLGEQPTISEPIIPDALMIISNNPNAIRFNNKEEYDEFASVQKYFSASHSHCFYSMENKEYFHKNGSHYADSDEGLSDVLFNTGRDIVQVWDNKNQIGYVVPGTY
jgi:hypothetical protein